MSRLTTALQTFAQDLKYGFRQLCSNPGFTAVAILTLALGIGVNTSIFSVLNALIIRPLAVANSGRLLEIYRGADRPCSYSDFKDFAQRTTAFSGLAADVTTESALDVGHTSKVILAESVSYNYAAVLQVKPALGRWFNTEDEHTGEYPAVISYLAWQSWSAGAPDVIGKHVRLESQWYTVVGVAPKSFQGMALPVLTEVWVPLARYAQHNQFAASVMNNRLEHRVMMFGRLNPGVSATQAQGELNTLDAQLRRQYLRPEPHAAALRLEHARGTADPSYGRMVAPLLVLLSVVVALVLLISCANVANLLLGRGVSRRREISVRLSLGGSRARICRQMLTESLLLSIMGAVSGIAAAQAANRLLESALASAPSPEALGATLSVDGRVLGFVLIACIVTTLLFGLIPALQASKPDVVAGLKGRETFARNRRFTLRNVSVVAQVTLSLVLLIVAGLFIKALQKATNTDPGFDARKLLSARLYIAKPEFNQTTGVAFYRRVLRQVRAMPGVQDATLSYGSPSIGISECVIPEKTTASLSATVSGENIVGSDYLSTFGIPLVLGRDFLDSDTETARPVVIINQTMARHYWPNGNPVGESIRIGDGCEKGLGSIAEIVGVAKDAQYATRSASMQPYLFLPFEQHFVGYVSLVIETRNPSRLAALLRKELSTIDARLRIYEISTISDQMEQSLWQTRWEAGLLSGFGMLALIIASVGLYGVVAFAMRQRTREFGIRLAVGARRRDVLQLVTSDALAVTSSGIALGLVLALACSNLLRGFLSGLSPADPATYAGAALLWIAVCLVASGAPAYRATSVDPAVTLRDE